VKDVFAALQERKGSTTGKRLVLPKKLKKGKINKKQRRRKKDRPWEQTIGRTVYQDPKSKASPCANLSKLKRKLHKASEIDIGDDGHGIGKIKKGPGSNRTWCG